MSGNINTTLDCTTRIKALEEENRRLKEMLLYKNNAIANSINGIVLADLSGKILEVNKAFLHLWAYEQDSDVIGKSVAELCLHPECAENIIRKLFLTNGWIGELTALKKNLHTFDAGLTASVINNEQGEPIALFASFQDISQSKEEARKLEESEKKYRLLAENAANAVFRINLLSGEYEHISPSLEKVTGYTPSDFYNNPFYIREIVHPGFLDYVEQKFDRLYKGIQDSTYEYVIIDKAGNERWILQHNTLLTDDKGAPLALEGSVVNITEKKLAELELRALMEKLVELNKDKDRFFQVLAHDLKNPFNTLLGYSKLLEENIDIYERDKVKKQVRVINQAAQHTYDLLEDLLWWAQSQADMVPFSPEPLILVDVFYQLKQMYVPNQKMIDIQIIANENFVVYADLNMLKTILRNLISNAMKFSHSNSIVFLQAEKNKNMVDISIVDFGIGMSSDMLKKIWNLSEPISREGTQGEKGTGLGLLLCKGFVEKHCSILQVESTEGLGTTFSFTLPSSPA